MPDETPIPWARTRKRMEDEKALDMARDAYRELMEIHNDPKKQKELEKVSIEEMNKAVACIAQLTTKKEEIVAHVIERASEVIGNRDKALRWMGTPIRALDFATPISLLGTKKGAQRVNRVLGQMEHGIW